MIKTFSPPLSGNLLKCIAAIAMVFDHVGLMLYPNAIWFRVIGRLSLPIFGFFIAEGCRYTKNRARYFWTIFCMAAVYQVVSYFVMRSLYMSIFVTFSLSILLIYLLDGCKRAIFDPQAKRTKKIAGVGHFFLALIGVLLLNFILEIDYGFFGTLIPLFASLPHKTENTPQALAKWDTIPAAVLCACLPMVGLLFTSAIPVQPYSFLAIPLLLLYSGKRGKYRLKYFFYVFYPAHLVVIYAISYFL